MIRTILINCGSTCHRICRRSWFKLSNCPKTEPRTFCKNGFQHFRQKSNLYLGFGRNCLGQNYRNDRLSFHIFVKIVNSISVLHVKVNVFTKTRIFIFSVQTVSSSSDDGHVRRLSSQNIEYNPCSFFKATISHRYSGIFIASTNFIDFDRFSLISIDFHIIYNDLHRIPLIFTAFH